MNAYYHELDIIKHKIQRLEFLYASKQVDRGYFYCPYVPLQVSGVSSQDLHDLKIQTIDMWAREFVKSDIHKLDDEGIYIVPHRWIRRMRFLLAAIDALKPIA